MVLKIIDLGFGKQIQYSGDFDKSINLSVVRVTRRFKFNAYDLVLTSLGNCEELLRENAIKHFKYLLEDMCQIEPQQRVFLMSLR